VLNAVIGGCLIGLAAVVLFIGIGRIAGISGISAAVLRAPRANLWGWGFLLGLIAGGVSMRTLLGIAPLQQLSDLNIGLLLSAGALVGFGTRLGSGCTSGHGVCGLARFSPRSAVATMTFLAVGMLVATLLWGVL
jgi:uncharacterized protein